MTPEEFVREFSSLKQNYLRKLFSNDKQSLHAAALIMKLALTTEQKAILPEVLNAVVTDILYTILIGLDGEAQIGSTQMCYTVLDEQGNTICDGSGEIEAYAYQAFHA